MGDQGRARVLLLNQVSGLSGAEESLLSLVEAQLRSHATKFEFIAACPDGPLAARLEEIGVRVDRIPLRRLHRRRNPAWFASWLFNWRAAVRRLALLIKAERIDIVHSNSTEAHLYGAAAARRAGVPCVWHARDLIPLSGLGRLLARRCRSVIAISDVVAVSLQSQGVPADAIRRIYNGIDAAEFRRQAGTVSDIPSAPGERWVVMVAQLVPWKRHADFIEAMSLLARHENVRGIIVGDDVFGDHPRYLAELERLCSERGVADRVTFAGRRRDVASIVARAEVFVLPSEGEPFGRAALEAMALGKPIVATRSGGLPELVMDGETGLLVGVRRPKELAQAIEKLLLDRRLASEMGRRGSLRAESFFDAATSAEEVTRLYEEILARRGQ